MNLLLDTCAILHIALEPNRLSQFAREAVTTLDRDVFVSPISSVELACLQQRKRIELPQHWRVWFRSRVEENGWNLTPITLEILEEAWSLPEPVHRDPVDRILIATARVERLTLITTDRLILDYPHLQAVQ